MSKDIILKVENVSKQYRLGTVGTGTISHDFNRFLAKIRGKEDPYLKVGATNDRSSKSDYNYYIGINFRNFKFSYYFTSRFYWQFNCQQRSCILHTRMSRKKRKNI